MILQNKFLRAATLNPTISLIAADLDEYRKVQPGTTRRKITRKPFTNQSDTIELQSNPMRNLI